MTASAEGPAKGWAAEAIYDRLLGRMASLATGHAGNVPTLRLAAGLSGHEVQPPLSGKGRRRRSGRAAVALGPRLVTRRTRHHRFAGWSQLARGGIRHERVDFKDHKDFFRFGSERVLLDIIRRHVLEVHAAGHSSI